jgi:hypothetical protein
MSTSLKTSAFLDISNRARAHVLRGGGVTPDSYGEHEEAISTIVNQHLGGRAAQADLEAALAELEPDIRDRVLAAVWNLVALEQDAGFVFGAAVGLQLRQVVPIESKEGAQS